MQTPPNPNAAAPKRRQYSPEVKAEVVAACKRSDQPVSIVAQAHGVGASEARRWVREAQRCEGVAPLDASRAPAVPGFAPVQLASAPAQAKDIRLELSHRGFTVSVSWPCEAASDCAAWMRELLR